MNNEQRAAEAQQLLDNPILNEAIDNIRERIISQLISTTAEDTNYRQELIVALQVQNTFKSNLQDDINTVLLDQDLANTG